MLENHAGMAAGTKHSDLELEHMLERIRDRCKRVSELCMRTIQHGSPEGEREAFLSELRARLLQRAIDSAGGGRDSEPPSPAG
jgi:hypothetical protein